MIHLPDAIRRMNAQAEAIRALAQTFAGEQANWKPNAESWSLKEVLEHLYNEERGDFRRHLRTMWGEAQQPGGYTPTADANEALEGFLDERAASTAWLAALNAPGGAPPDWGATITLHFGPTETRTFSAGDMLVSWVEHDILHLRQLVELMHAWNERQSAPYATEYAGGW